MGELRLLAHGAQLLLSLAEDLDPPVRAWDMLFARGRTCRELLGLVQLLAVGAELLVQLCTRLAMRDLVRVRVRVSVRVKVRGLHEGRQLIDSIVANLACMRQGEG